MFVHPTPPLFCPYFPVSFISRPLCAFRSFFLWLSCRLVSPNTHSHWLHLKVGFSQPTSFCWSLLLWLFRLLPPSNTNSHWIHFKYGLFSTVSLSQPSPPIADHLCGCRQGCHDSKQSMPASNSTRLLSEKTRHTGIAVMRAPDCQALDSDMSSEPGLSSVDPN